MSDQYIANRERDNYYCGWNIMHYRKMEFWVDSCPYEALKMRYQESQMHLHSRKTAYWTSGCKVSRWGSQHKTGEQQGFQINYKQASILWEYWRLTLQRY